MADLLDGTKGHAHFAPLSQSQTVAISRHLQDQIRKIEQKLEELEVGQKRTDDFVGQLKDGSDGLQVTMATMQDALTGTRNAIDSARKELTRSNGVVQKIQAGQEQAQDAIGTLRDAQKVTTTSLKKMGQDLLGTHSLAVKLQEAIERRLDVDVAQIRDELSKTNLEIRHVRADEDMLKSAIRDEREALRETNLKVKAVSDDITEVRTVVTINEQRMTDAAAGFKSARQIVDDLNNAVLKLHEDHDNTKNIVQELAASNRRVTTHIKQVEETVSGATTEIVVAQNRLEEQADQMDYVRQVVQVTQTKVQGLHEGHERTRAALNDLRSEVAEVGATTQAVRAGLKETSYLLLPNIMDSAPDVRTVVAERHGSLLHLGGGPLTPLTSPKHSRPAEHRLGGGGGGGGGAPNGLAKT